VERCDRHVRRRELAPIDGNVLICCSQPEGDVVMICDAIWPTA
jgi:hypothetical protein